MTGMQRDGGEVIEHLIGRELAIATVPARDPGDHAEHGERGHREVEGPQFALFLELLQRFREPVRSTNACGL